MSAIGETVMISWVGFGVIIEHEKETEDRLEISISVPEHSYAYSNDGSEIQNNHV
jgi:RNA polymerase subunit RPABC4/transcription elongation factor Spt4